jgi:hypothetical protein
MIKLEKNTWIFLRKKQIKKKYLARIELEHFDQNFQNELIF